MEWRDPSRKFVRLRFEIIVALGSQLELMLETNNNQPFEQPMSIRAVEAYDSVSVIIPCYNEERFIGKALEQLADQFESDRYEIVVIDGRSEDRTRAVVDEFKTRRPDVSVLLIENPA